MITLRQRFFARTSLPNKNLTWRIIAPVLLVLSIALPEYFHFQIERSPPSLEVIQLLTQEPNSKLLEEVSAMVLAVPIGIPSTARTETARKILSGSVDVPDFLTTPISLTGWPRDLIHGGPTLQLSLASLELENLLLETFERERNSNYYQAARDRILAFAAWEENQREPVAFLWNDHAIAARIPVLIRLWRHLRNDAQATPSQKAALIALVIRSGELLGKDSQFTVRTNHGVMQNVALLQIGAAFPSLPKIAAWRKSHPLITATYELPAIIVNSISGEIARAKAEAFLSTWQDALPFGRPLA